MGKGGERVWLNGNFDKKKGKGVAKIAGGE